MDVNLWGMLGCAVAYAGALFAGVDGFADHLLRRHAGMNDQELSAMRLKTGSKIAAAIITVVTAGIVLILDSNWIAFSLLSIVFVAILLWVWLVYRSVNRADHVAPR